MRRIRVIPVLLLENGRIFKTVRFSKPVYIGDPVNIVKIYNEKEVDELMVLDFQASRSGKSPDFVKLAEIAGEAFMPMGYGGGITSVEDMRRIIYCGYEKIVLNTASFFNKQIITQGAELLGSQSVVVSVDYKRNLFGKQRVFVRGGRTNTGINPVEFAKEMEALGAGELVLHSIERDGTYSSYDIDLISEVSSMVSIPVVACGGAGTLNDFVEAIKAGASAVAAGSMFVYHGSNRGILPNYPTQKELEERVFAHV